MHTVSGVGQQSSFFIPTISYHCELRLKIHEIKNDQFWREIKCVLPEYTWFLIFALKHEFELVNILKKS